MRRNNHYNSQMYLKAWECEKNKTFVYDLLVSDEKVPLWRKNSIENLCSINSLFVRLKNNEETDDLEKWFSEKYESPAKEPLDKAISGKMLTNEDIHKLINFMACHIVRTPAFIDRVLKQGKREGQEILETEVEKFNDIEKDNIINIVDKNIEYNDEMFPLKVSVMDNQNSKENALLKVETIIGKQFYLWIMKHLLENTTKELHKHKWRIIDVHKDVILPTSDDPVLCLNYNSKNDYDFGGGWGRKNCNILFPISPNKIFYTQIGSANIDNLSVNYEMSCLFKKMIVEHAYRKIISNCEDNDIKSIRRRTVDRNAFINEKRMWKEFQDNYLKEERKYIK